ncbi:MAG: hypothetical protein IKQ36_07245 [Clostridia bacterium]|nr:hypothetical protein [Clostridia bacterium]
MDKKKQAGAFFADHRSKRSRQRLLHNNIIAHMFYACQQLFRIFVRINQYIFSFVEIA